MIKYILSIFLFLTFTGGAGATTINVTVGDNYISPVSFDAAVGDTIIWTLDSSAVASHSTTSASLPEGALSWDHNFTGAGDSYAYVVNAEGVYKYHCKFNTADMRASFSTSVPLPLHEDFIYPTGDNLTLHGWVAHSEPGVNPTTLNDGSLTFPGYPSSGTGNAALLSGNSEDEHRLFESQTADSVYMAFLVNVTDNPSGYFIHFGTNPFSTYFRGKVHLEGTDSNLGFGLSFSVETSVSTSYNYSFGTTYLLVLKYTVVEGANNDKVSLYVLDSSFPMEEPSVPTIGPITNPKAFDINPGAVSLRKYSASENLMVDGIRIANTWIEAVPVELVSFTASVEENDVKLNWKTAAEVNNRGFEVQRKTSVSDWNIIAFINGNGTSARSHEYNYIDNNMESGKYYYRLKQLDLDGSYQFSKVTEIVVNPPVKFELAQNYPNPFNPTTRIDYLLPSSGNIKLSVYNVLGQEVAVLVNGFTESGNHSVDFDASELNSGLYFYKLESNGISYVKKMVLIK